MTQLVPAGAAPAAVDTPVLPAGSESVIVIDVLSGDLLSVTSTKPVSDAMIKQFDVRPGAKTYVLDTQTGQLLSITRT